MESLPIIGILVLFFEILIVLGLGASIFLTLLNREKLNRLLGLEGKLDSIEKYLADLSEEVAMDMGPSTGHFIQAASLDELMDKMQQSPIELDQEESDKLRAFFENMLNQEQQNFGVDMPDDEDDEPDKPWENKKK
jgi:hypothetical protein